MERIYKPNSVRARDESRALDDHSSGRAITGPLVRPTRRRFRGHIDRGRRGPPELSRTSVGTVSLFGLAPQGVCLAEYVATLAGDAFTSPFHHRPPRASEGVGLSLLCCTLPSGRPAWPLASLLSYGVRTFLYLGRFPDGKRNGQRSPDLLHEFESVPQRPVGAKRGGQRRQLTVEPGISYSAARQSSHFKRRRRPWRIGDRPVAGLAAPCVCWTFSTRAVKRERRQNRGKLGGRRNCPSLRVHPPPRGTPARHRSAVGRGVRSACSIFRQRRGALGKMPWSISWRRSRGQ